MVLFKDVMDEAIKRVLAVRRRRGRIYRKKNEEHIAEQIGLGALAYSMLSVDNNKDIVFNINEALNFDGHTGPYIQNAYVHANSILKKSNGLLKRSRI